MTCKNDEKTSIAHLNAQLKRLNEEKRLWTALKSDLLNKKLLFQLKMGKLSENSIQNETNKKSQLDRNRKRRKLDQNGPSKERKDKNERFIKHCKCIYEDLMLVEAHWERILVNEMKLMEIKWNLKGLWAVMHRLAYRYLFMMDRVM